MAKNGFISNRIFDLLSSGSKVITDYVDGLEELLQPPLNELVLVYSEKSQLPDLVSKAKEINVDKHKIHNFIAKEHSYMARCKTICNVLKDIE
jgi:spore maturation protein CgeB